MLNRFISIVISLISVMLILSFTPVSAKNDNRPDVSFVPPEKEGTYDVPGHPNMKVRVFIHREKGKGNAKPPKPSPTPTPEPQLTCELTDGDSSAVDKTTGWHLPAYWRYNLNQGSVPSSVGGSNLPTIAASGVSVWRDAISNKINVERGSNTTQTRARFDGENIIAWGRTQGTALAVAYTWYYTDTKEVAEVDTIMNKSYRWSWSGSSTCAYPDSYDAQNILTHEIGHWFGVDDMYSNPYLNNTMYGYGSTEEVKKVTLTEGDKVSVSSIY